MNCALRPERTGDIRSIHEVNAEAFEQENEAVLVDAIRQSPGFLPELSIVAEHESAIIGHILFSIVHIDAGREKKPVLCLAPMAVRTAMQRRGIGSQLVRHGLVECRRLGWDVVIVLGHPNFYPRFGFVPASSRGVVSPWPVPDEAFMVNELIHGALDGIDGEVTFPSLFDEV